MADRLTIVEDALGVGLWSNTVHNWNDAINYSESFQGDKATLTSQEAFRLIGRGDAPDLRLHTNIHFTLTPQGVLEVTADNYRFDCSNAGPA